MIEILDLVAVHQKHSIHRMHAFLFRMQVEYLAICYFMMNHYAPIVRNQNNVRRRVASIAAIN